MKRQKTGCCFASQRHMRLTWRPSWDLGNACGMHTSCRLKGAGLITLLLVPDGKKYPDPHIGECTYGDRVALAFCSFPLVIGLSPLLLMGRLPSKLKQGIAQWLDTAHTSVGLGIRPTLKEDRRGPGQGLQT